MDYLIAENTLKSYRIEQLEAILLPLLEKKQRKKVTVNPQQQFVDTVAIKAAQEAQQVKDEKEAQRACKWAA